MYELKERLDIPNQKEFAELIGISEQQLSYIQNKKKCCSKVLAFSITIHYNANLEIEDLFLRRK